MTSHICNIPEVWRWYSLHLAANAAKWVDRDDAETAARHACSCLVWRAMKGYPTPMGPHQFAYSSMCTFLSRANAWYGADDEYRMGEAWWPLTEREVGQLLHAMGDIFILAQACDANAILVDQITELAKVFDPMAGLWTDGFHHAQDVFHVKSKIALADAAIDDTDNEHTLWYTRAELYMEGERQRHCGWTAALSAPEGAAHGQ